MSERLHEPDSDGPAKQEDSAPRDVVHTLRPDAAELTEREVRVHAVGPGSADEVSRIVETLASLGAPAVTVIYDSEETRAALGDVDADLQPRGTHLPHVRLGLAPAGSVVDPRELEVDTVVQADGEDLADTLGDDGWLR